MNVPNRLTILRVVMIPLFVVAMLWETLPYHEYIALALFVGACITDFFDGYLARKYNQITTFGKFMDPLADKLLVCAAMICFLTNQQTQMPAWAVIVIISREFIISGFRLVAADNGIVIAASYWGKFKTVFQMTAVVLLIFNIPALSVLTSAVLWIAVILTVVSLVDYVAKNIKVLTEGGL